MKAKFSRTTFILLYIISCGVVGEDGVENVTTAGLVSTDCISHDSSGNPCHSGLTEQKTTKIPPETNVDTMTTVKDVSTAASLSEKETDGGKIEKQQMKMQESSEEEPTSNTGKYLLVATLSLFGLGLVLGMALKFRKEQRERRRHHNVVLFES